MEKTSKREKFRGSDAGRCRAASHCRSMGWATAIVPQGVGRAKKGVESEKWGCNKKGGGI